MLKYSETNWKYERGFGIHEYDLAIGTINPSKTRKEQQTKIEKISLVAFLNKDEKNFRQDMQTPQAEQQGFIKTKISMQHYLAWAQ